MIGARELEIEWGDDQRYWSWIDEPNSRFGRVAQLRIVWLFHISGRIETEMLLPKTTYAAYLVFRFEDLKSGFHRPATSRVSVESDERGEWPTVILDPREGEPRSASERGDGWLEIKMGEFYNENGDEGTLVCSLREFDGYITKKGLVVEGIELRPKETDQALYRYLYHHPVQIDGRNVSWSLDTKSGKKCFMIGARELEIEWGDDQRYWSWIDEPNSRFGRVAQLRIVWLFYITGRIETEMLSPKTTYAAYLVFQFKDFKRGFHRPVASRVSVKSDERREWPNVILDPWEGEPRSASERGDGWLEIEMGEFYNENGDDGTLVCSLREFDGYTVKRGLVVEGIELRPKET